MGKLLRIDPLARRLGGETPQQRMKALLEADGATERVQALEPYALYALVGALGAQQAAPLVHLASGEQAQGLLDFGTWTGDQLDLARLDDWLSQLVEAPIDDAERLLGGLDTELVGLFLVRHLRGIYLREDEDDAEAIDRVEGPMESSPDGVYALAMPDGEDESRIVRAVLQRLYTRDQDQARQLLQAARWELESQLEETAYQMRAGRIAQSGFMPTEESIALLARSDPSAQRAQAQKLLAQPDEPIVAMRSEGAVDVEAPLAAVLMRLTDEGGSFFGRALRRAADGGVGTEVADRLLLQLRTLTRGLAMAERRDPGDLGEVSRAFARAHSGLTIGLEYLARGDLAAASKLLLLWPLKKVFGVGFNLVAALSRQAKRLTERGQLSLVDELPASLARDDESDLVAGLLRWPPVASALEDRDFRELSEVERTAQTLALLAYKALWTFGFQGLTRDRLAALVTEAGAVAGLDEIGFDGLLATRAALAFLGAGGPLRPLARRELESVTAAAIKPESLAEELADALTSVAQPPQGQGSAVSGRLADRWTADVAAALVEGYGGLRASDTARPELLPKLLLARRD